MKTKLFTLLVALGLTLSFNAKAGTVSVGATGTYTSITAAITAVSPISEPLIIELTSDYSQTTDDITAVTGASATNTVTIRPQTGVATLTVAGSGTYVWRMNGCQYVTIDGRAGGTGPTILTLRADTVIGNSLTTALKKSIALQITNNSSNNVIQYVNLKAATNEGFWNSQPATAPTMGTITLGAGSTNITIDHCDVGPLHAYTGTPTVAIVSLGTITSPNSGIVISNNNIYDYFARDLNKCQTVPGMGVGVLIYDYNSNCTVSGNSFYQTLTRSVFANQANAKTASIAIQNASGSGFIVKNNYIGGSQPLCGGTVYSNIIGNNTSFNGIHIGASNTGTSAVYGNTIKNLYIYAHSPIAQVYQSAGIYIAGGNVLVGINEDGTTASPNIIGDQSAAAVGTSNASITFTGSSTNAAFSAILFNSLAGANVKISNNKIAGICVKAYATSRTASFIGINILGTAASTCLIDKNEIGNNDTNVSPTSMSIQNYQGRGCFGIYMNTSGATTSVMTISNNKINNMYKPTEAIVTTNQTYVNGIWFNASVIAFPVTITNNEIRDLVFSSNRINDTQYYWSSGITFGGIAAGSVISNNKIYNIEGQGAYSTSVIGINLLPTANATTIDVYNNLIYNLSSDKTRKLSQFATGLTGIFTNNYGSTTITPTLNVYNNMIRLGYNRAGNELSTISTIVGVRDSMVSTGAAKANYYNNTIYLGGTNVVASDTVPTFGMCFATSATNAVTRILENNLIVNARSNASTCLSKHYAIGTGSANALTAYTFNYNDYAVTGTDGVLGRFTNKTDAVTLSAVQAYTGDANSINVIPIFVSATSATPDLHLNQTNAGNSTIKAGLTITTPAITADYDANSRAATPTIGADEFNFIAPTAATDHFRSKASGNWSDVATWESSADNSNWITSSLVPTATATDVTVRTGNTVALTANAVASVLAIQSGSTLSANAGTQLTVNTTLTNNGTLNLLSDASATATILTPSSLSGSGTYNVSQYLTSGRNWYLSSPVSSATSSVVNAVSNALYYYDESAATWSQISDNTTGLTVMKGYVANLSTTGAVSFSGTINNGAQSINVNRTASQIKEGFNLIGNPYPSYLDWDQVSKTNIMSTIWYRTKTAVDAYTFDTYNSTGQIVTSNGVKLVTNQVPPMQAFWVRVANGQTSGSVAVSNSNRSHADNGLNTFKTKSSATSTQPVLRLVVSNGTNSDQAVVYYNSAASNAFDDYDSPKMSNNLASIPEIYTLAGTEQVVINGLNDMTIMTLGFTTGEANNFTIKASQFLNFVSGTQIILHDNLLNSDQDLTVSDYNFYSDVTINNESRFTLMVKAPSVATGINGNSNGHAWISLNGNNQIVVNGLTNAETTVTVCNEIGQKMISRQVTSTNKVLNTQFTSGVYMVTLTEAGKNSTTKVIIK